MRHGIQINNDDGTNVVFAFQHISRMKLMKRQAEPPEYGHRMLLCISFVDGAFAEIGDQKDIELILNAYKQWLA